MHESKSADSLPITIFRDLYWALLALNKEYFKNCKNTLNDYIENLFILWLNKK